MNKKVYDAVKSGKSDNNIDYNDFVNLILALGFVFDRQNGSHKTFRNDDGYRMNVQPYGNKAKGYQVKELRKLINLLGL